MKYVQLAGNFLDLPIEVFMEAAISDVPIVTVIVKGLYGVVDPQGQDDEVLELGKALTSNGISNVVYFNSSRRFIFKPNTSHLEREKAFEGKTFEQELADLSAVLTYAQKKSKAFFNMGDNWPTLYLHGNSLGGTLAILSTAQFGNIKKLSLCAPPLQINSSTNKPLMATFPASEKILHAIQNYVEELQIIYGSEDTVVPENSPRTIYEHAGSAKKQFKKIAGANHNFSTYFGKEGVVARDIFVKEAFDFLTI